MASRRRPEAESPPEFFYNETEARKYTLNSHLIKIQTEMTERALELLAIEDDESRLLLDIGCGSGLSGEVLSEADHSWVGVDISSCMLNIALEREVEGDMILCDIGNGLPFRAGVFDGAISISVLQWLSNSYAKSHNPVKRLYRLFSSLYSCLRIGARAVFQFYPENDLQVEVATQQAMKAGFTGGLVVDYPESTKAKKMFLVLFACVQHSLPKGYGQQTEVATAVEEHARNEPRLREIRKNAPGKVRKKSREWILKKKRRAELKGKEVKRDSAYTGRVRKGKF